MSIRKKSIIEAVMMLALLSLVIYSGDGGIIIALLATPIVIPFWRNEKDRFWKQRGNVASVMWLLFFALPGIIGMGILIASLFVDDNVRLSIPYILRPFMILAGAYSFINSIGKSIYFDIYHLYGSPNPTVKNPEWLHFFSSVLYNLYYVVAFVCIIGGSILLTKLWWMYKERFSKKGKL